MDIMTIDQGWYVMGYVYFYILDQTTTSISSKPTICFSKLLDHWMIIFLVCDGVSCLRMIIFSSSWVFSYLLCGKGQADLSPQFANSHFGVHYLASWQFGMSICCANGFIMTSRFLIALILFSQEADRLSLRNCRHFLCAHLLVNPKCQWLPDYVILAFAKICPLLLIQKTLLVSRF